jgi:hypothetical protein
LSDRIWEREGSEQVDFQAVLRAAERLKPGAGSIQDWIELDEGHPESQLLFVVVK